MPRDWHEAVAEATVLIPAAAPTPELFGGPSTSAMTPVAGRPVIQWTLSYLIGLGFTRFRIGVRPEAAWLTDFVTTLLTDDHDVAVVTMETASLGQTVRALAEDCPTERGLIVLGDTFFEFDTPAVLVSDDPLVLVGEVQESARWCIAHVDEGLVRSLSDKVPGLADPLEALVGVYLIPRLSELANALQEGENGDPPDFTEGLRSFVFEDRLHAVRAGKWFDAGHADRRSNATRRLMAQRAFNSLQVNDLSGTIRKSSTNVQKFINEINYIRLLPNDLAIYFPRLVDFSVLRDNPWVELEFYGYPTLAELFLYHDLDPAAWRQIFEHLHTVLARDFGRHVHPIDRADVRAMYIGKIDDRLGDLRSEPRLGKLIDEPYLTVNGKRLANLGALHGWFEVEVDRLCDSTAGTVIHGDFCLSNILYDLRTSICRFIDPRGSFGTPGIGGDIRYDVAKLWHSVHGHYDLIVNDLFDIQYDSSTNSVLLEIHTRSQHDAARDAMADVFFKDFDRRDITIICGLIFCSIPALHYDHADRQLAMYVRGLQLLDEARGQS